MRHAFKRAVSVLAAASTIFTSAVSPALATEVTEMETVMEQTSEEAVSSEAEVVTEAVQPETPAETQAPAETPAPEVAAEPVTEAPVIPDITIIPEELELVTEPAATDPVEVVTEPVTEPAAVEPVTEAAAEPEAATEPAGEAVVTEPVTEVVTEPEKVYGEVYLVLDGQGGEILFTTGDGEDDTKLVYRMQDGKRMVDDGSGAVEAVVDEKDRILVLTEEVGTKVTVEVKADEAYRIAEYARMIDAGGEERAAEAEGFDADVMSEYKQEFDILEETQRIEVSFREVPVQVSEEPETVVTETEEATEEETEAITEEASEEFETEELETEDSETEEPETEEPMTEEAEAETEEVEAETEEVETEGAKTETAGTENVVAISIAPKQATEPGLEAADAQETENVNILAVLPENAEAKEDEQKAILDGGSVINLAPVDAADSDSKVYEFAEYDAYVASVLGMEVERTEFSMDFYNTLVDNSNIGDGTTIESLFSGYQTPDELFALEPTQQVETVPIYRGADGYYYVISSMPKTLGREAVDYQAATNFYTVLANAYTDVVYLGNGVYQIPAERYEDCYTTHEVDGGEMGTITVQYGMRIQVLYGYEAEEAPDYQAVTANITYPDGTVQTTVALVDMATGSAAIQLADEEEAAGLNTEDYEINVSINRGQVEPEDLLYNTETGVLSFLAGDGNAISVIDVEITAKAKDNESLGLMLKTADDGALMLAVAAVINGMNVMQLSKSSVPSNLAKGDVFLYENITLAMAGLNDAYDGLGQFHIGASSVSTRLAQYFSYYQGQDTGAVSTWFKSHLADPNYAEPLYMVPMTDEYIIARSQYNNAQANVGGQRLFGYITTPLGSVTTNGKTLNLEGNRVIVACMHAWAYESDTTPTEVVDAIEKLTGRRDYTPDYGYGHYHPNLALQCTGVETSGEYKIATFKCVSSMLAIGRVDGAPNYQCGFSTLKIAYEDNQPGYVGVQKSSSAAVTSSKYSLAGAVYGVYPTRADGDAGTNLITTLTTGADGKVISSAAQSALIKAGTRYYVHEITAPANFKLDPHTYGVNASTSAAAVVNADTGLAISQEEPEYGNIQVQKKLAEDTYPLQKAVFSVYTDSECKTLFDTITVTAVNTYVKGSSAKNYEIGKTYYVKETEVLPNTINLDTTVYPVVASKDAADANSKLIVTDTVSHGKIGVKKQYAGQDVVALVSATYALYSTRADAEDAKNAIASVTITGDDAKNGTVKYFNAELAIGTKYYVKETSVDPADKITMDTNVYEVTANQAGAVAVSTDTLKSGWLVVEKKSARTDVTNDNACYSIEGIAFKVYTDAACTKEATDAAGAAITMVTGANGRTNAVAVVPGTYYVKEDASSVAGKGFAPNMRAERITVSENDTASKPVMVSITNTPLLDPVGVLLKKVSETGAGCDTKLAV